MSRSLIITLTITGMVIQSSGAVAQQEKKAPPEATNQRKATPEEFIKHYDKNGDGTLDKDEVPALLASLFPQIDADGDGKLTVREIAAVIKAGEGPGKDSPVDVELLVTTILDLLDVNKDGKLSKAEARGPLAQNFEKADANKDGFLDRTELRQATVFIRPPPIDGTFRRDFDALDRNADGRLTREELKGTPYADTFDAIDTGKDGQIDRKEFAAHLKKQVEKKAP